MLGSADKEELRDLVAEIGREIRSCLGVGEAGYARAAALVAELLELRIVDHGFVASLVAEEVQGAVEERVAEVGAVVGAVFVDGALDGADEVEDARRLEEARAALHSVRQMLAAFAGVEEVAAQLDGSIAETAAMIERAERRRAEAAGRREMATELQEALRTVGAHSLGEGYNVVRETLQLPRIAASVREGRRRRRAALESAHAAEMRGLASEPPAVVAAAREGHAVAAREARLRDEMADAAWAAHLEEAGAALARRDELLLRDKGEALCTKVRTTREALDAAPALLDLSRSSMAPADMDVAATLLRTLPSLAALRALLLSGNQLGDAGLTALADAAAHGALSQLERLYLDNVQLGDQAAAELAAALDTGALSLSPSP